MACITRGFGAPVTDAGGNVARTRSPSPIVGSQSPAHGAHEMGEAGMLLDGEERGHVDRPVLADAAEVVAGQVDDHQVLGMVLGARGEDRPVDGRSLDRTRLDRTTVDAQEQLRRRRHDRDARQRVGRTCRRPRTAPGSAA